jgi:hypothetical protein
MSTENIYQHEGGTMINLSYKILFMPLLIVAFTAGGLLGTANSARADADLTQAGDILQIALPVTAFLSTYLHDDPEGRA